MMHRLAALLGVCLVILPATALAEKASVGPLAVDCSTSPKSGSGSKTVGNGDMWTLATVCVPRGKGVYIQITSANHSYWIQGFYDNPYGAMSPAVDHGLAGQSAQFFWDNQRDSDQWTHVKAWSEGSGTTATLTFNWWVQ